MTRWKSSDINRLKNQGAKKVQGWRAQPALPFPGEGQSKPKKKRATQEFQLQIACVALFDMLYPELRQLFFHIPNQAVINDPRIGGFLKAMGRRRGVWDNHLAVARNGWQGMWVEFKSDDGELTKEQIEFRDALQDRYLFVVIKTKNGFGFELQKYLGPSSRTNYSFTK